MLKRTITGLAILIIVAGAILLRYISTMFFDFFVLIISVVAAFEMLKATRNKNEQKQVYSYLVVIYPSVLFGVYLLSTSVLQTILFQFLALLLFFIVSMAIELFELNKSKNKNQTIETTSLLNKTFKTMCLLFYPTTLLGFLYGINAFGLNIGLIGIIIMFAVSMFTDVFAYFFGTITKGKGPRLCVQISPKKGVVGMLFGALGGLIASGLSYLLFVHLGYLGDVFLGIKTTTTILAFVLLGIFGTFLTQFGDLVSSTIKRKHNIKDFGSIFPGHGGILDRVDGLMFNAVLVFSVFALIF